MTKNKGKEELFYKEFTLEDGHSFYVVQIKISSIASRDKIFYLCHSIFDISMGVTKSLNHWKVWLQMEILIWYKSVKYIEQNQIT